MNLKYSISICFLSLFGLVAGKKQQLSSGNIEPTQDTEEYICLNPEYHISPVDKPGQDCYPKMFEPTDEFQIIKEGQMVPKGLHYTIDMVTGVRMAKLLSKDEQNEPQANLIVKDVFIPNDSANQQVVNVNVDDTIPPAKKENTNLVIVESPDYETDEKDSNPLKSVNSNGKLKNTKASSERKSGGKQTQSSSANSSNKLYRFEEFFGNANHDTDYEKFVEMLGDLEELAHDTEVGLEVIKSRVLYDMLTDFSGPERIKDEINSMKAITLGASLQNNYDAQIKSLEKDVIVKMIRLFKKESSPVVKNRLMYAISGVVRGNTKSLIEFESCNGPEIVLNWFDTYTQQQFLGFSVEKKLNLGLKTDNAARQYSKLRQKLALFMEDYYNPDMLLQQQPELKADVPPLLIKPGNAKIKSQGEDKDEPSSSGSGSDSDEIPIPIPRIKLNNNENSQFVFESKYQIAGNAETLNSTGSVPGHATQPSADVRSIDVQLWCTKLQNYVGLLNKHSVAPNSLLNREKSALAKSYSNLSALYPDSCPL